MTTNGNNLTSSPEGDSTSLESLAVDSSQLNLAELAARHQNTDTDKTIPSPQSHRERVIEVSTDLSELSSVAGATIRSQARHDITSTSSAARAAALHARLERLRERPAFVEKVRASSARNRNSTEKPMGILNNPFYKYRGGIFARVITLLANLLKFLEALILKRLSTPKIETKKIQVAPATSAETNPTEAAKKKREEEEKLKQRQKMQLPGARMGNR